MTHPRYHVTVELTAKPGQSPAVVLAALKELATASEREPGCTLFAVHQDSGSPDRFVIWESFHDEAAFKQHGAEAHSQKFNALGLVDLARISKSAAAGV